jgi:hypothetical protein
LANESWGKLVFGQLSYWALGGGEGTVRVLDVNRSYVLFGMYLLSLSNSFTLQRCTVLKGFVTDDTKYNYKLNKFY